MELRRAGVLEEINETSALTRVFNRRRCTVDSGKSGILATANHNVSAIPAVRAVELGIRSLPVERG